MVIILMPLAQFAFRQLAIALASVAVKEGTQWWKAHQEQKKEQEKRSVEAKAWYKDYKELKKLAEEAVATQEKEQEEAATQEKEQEDKSQVSCGCGIDGCSYPRIKSPQEAALLYENYKKFENSLTSEAAPYWSKDKQEKEAE